MAFIMLAAGAWQGFAPGGMPSSKACAVPILERAAVRRVQMGVRRKAQTGVSQTNGRLADILGAAGAGAGASIFPSDNMDSGESSLDAYKRKTKPPQAAKPQAKSSTETGAETSAESTQTTATDQGEKPTS